MFLLSVLNMLETEEEQHKFRFIYEQYKDLVMYLALERVHDYGLAEDVCQETFLAVARNLNKLDETNAKATKAYVAAIATGKAINAFHKEQTRQRISLDEVGSADVPDENAFTRFETMELKNAVNRLPEEDRMYLYLTYSFGYTSKEIGKMMNVTPETVRKHLQRARQQLKKMMEEGL